MAGFKNIPTTLVSMFLLLGCQTNQVKQTDSNYSPASFKPDYTEARETANNLIMKLEKRIDPKCQNRSVLTRTVYHDRYNPENRFDGADREEKWVINRCGEEVRYFVNYETRFELPDNLKTSVRIKPVSGSIPEHAYVMNLAERNNCEITGEPKLYKRRNSNNRVYVIPCGDTDMKFECGNGKCWRL